MIFNYTLKDVYGNHFKFTTRDHHPNIREALGHIESRLVAGFAGGEVVEVRRKFRGKERHAPLFQGHRPREIGTGTPDASGASK